MKNIRSFWAHGWQPALLGIIGVSLVASLLFFRLGGLVPGFSAPELTAVENSSSLQRIIDNPLNAPHKLGQLVFQAAGFEGAMAMRSVSVIFGLASVLLFFSVLRLWFTIRMAVLGTLLFMTSSWFLHTARFGTPDILQTGILSLVACGLWLRFSLQRAWAVLGASLVAVVCLYTPGLLWFVGVCVIWQRRTILKELRRMPVIALVLTILGSLALLTPLILAITSRPDLLGQLIGLPENYTGLEVIGKNLLQLPVQLFVRGPDNPVLWLGRLPVLDVFSIAMFALGMYYLYLRRRLDRAKLLFGILTAGALLTALGGSVTITILLPFIYIIITIGLNLLLQQWFTVFPRNPVARNLGLVLLFAAIMVSVFYNSTRYFIAWPNTPETKQAFSAKVEP